MKNWIFALAALLAPLPALALVNEIAQEGILIDAQGNPLQGQHSIRFRLYDAAAAGVVLFDETHPMVDLFEG